MKKVVSGVGFQSLFSLVLLSQSIGLSAADQSKQENLEFRAAIGAHHLASGLWVVGRDYRRTPEEVVAQRHRAFHVLWLAVGFYVSRG